jgi:hypothetical protein
MSLIGLDVGTIGCKAIVFDRSGRTTCWRRAGSRSTPHSVTVRSVSARGRPSSRRRLPSLACPSAALLLH